MATKLLLLLSDSHVGRWTERSNLKVVGLQFRKVGAELLQALRLTRDCNEVITALLGDIVEGDADSHSGLWFASVVPLSARAP